MPGRIVSLVPSQTELLHTLGLEHETVGITRFCIRPGVWFRTKARIGGTKDINFKKIDQLNPDLIIANKEENVKEQVNELATKYPVWVSDIPDIPAAWNMMRDIGVLTGKLQEADKLIGQIKKGFDTLPMAKEPIRSAYLIWRNPYMTVGGDTFISDMMHRSGFVNVFAKSSRYPVVTPEDLVETGCRLLMLSSEPYPFRQKHIDELQRQLTGVKIILVDGEYFSWYGSRMLKSPAYFKQLAQSLEV